MARQYKRKTPNITHNGIIDVWDFISFEEEPHEHGKRIYLDIQGLVDSAEHELRSNKRYKNFEVESYGVKRWEH
tara:strand:+ start:278 stop:499 length:222 start_codon:yes stop_codon:yes gene_type:complete